MTRKKYGLAIILSALLILSMMPMATSAQDSAEIRIDNFEVVQSNAHGGELVEVQITMSNTYDTQLTEGLRLFSDSNEITTVYKEDGTQVEMPYEVTLDSGETDTVIFYFQVDDIENPPEIRSITLNEKNPADDQLIETLEVVSDSTGLGQGNIISSSSDFQLTRKTITQYKTSSSDMAGDNPRSTERIPPVSQNDDGTLTLDGEGSGQMMNFENAIDPRNNYATLTAKGDKNVQTGLAVHDVPSSGYHSVHMRYEVVNGDTPELTLVDASGQEIDEDTTYQLGGNDFQYRTFKLSEKEQQYIDNNNEAYFVLKGQNGDTVMNIYYFALLSTEKPITGLADINVNEEFTVSPDTVDHAKDQDSFEVKATVKNTGNSIGFHEVELYVQENNMDKSKQPDDARLVYVAPGEERTVTFDYQVEDYEEANVEVVTKEREVSPGDTWVKEEHVGTNPVYYSVHQWRKQGQEDSGFTKVTPEETKSFSSGASPFELTFDTCGSTGRHGPNYCYYWDNKQDVYVDWDGIQHWTVPHSGYYRFTVEGAEGGGGWYGGEGATIRGTTYLHQGETVQILVGQQGDENGRASSGGGGTFVANSWGSPIIVAGGGAGAEDYVWHSVDADTDSTAKDGSHWASHGGYWYGDAGYWSGWWNPDNKACVGAGHYDNQNGCWGGDSFYYGGTGSYPSSYSYRGVGGGFGGGGGATSEPRSCYWWAWYCWGGESGAGGGGGFTGGGAGFDDSSWWNEVHGGGGGSYADWTVSNVDRWTGGYGQGSVHVRYIGKNRNGGTTLYKYNDEGSEEHDVYNWSTEVHGDTIYKVSLEGTDNVEDVRWYDSEQYNADETVDKSPDASIQGPSSALVGDQVTFTADVATTSTIETYDWTHNTDYIQNNDASYTVTFQSAGTHVIELEVENADGGKDVVRKTVNVEYDGDEHIKCIELNDCSDYNG